MLQLPKPKLIGGKLLANALRLRKTVREIRSQKVSLQVLSNVLFAARGINRMRGPFHTPGLTSASASNSQEVDVYVLLERGAYRFDSLHHGLLPVSNSDLRLLAYTPGQPLIAPHAPVQLVFVVDVNKLEQTSGFDEPGLHDPETQKAYYFVDTGLIAGNVYLFAAAHGLACWFHNCNRSALAKRLDLRETQHVLFAQTLGYAAKRGAHRAQS